MLYRKLRPIKQKTAPRGSALKRRSILLKTIEETNDNVVTYSKNLLDKQRKDATMKFDYFELNNRECENEK